jgi:hypothetical protein
MYRPLHAKPEARRGLILLVVLFMLTLLAIAGISFVLYADAEATAARGHRDAVNFPQPDMEPELAFSYFLGQLIYDCLDDETGIYSALRGHSLTRNMYGLNTTFDPTRNQWLLQNNYVPYHGPGRLHYPGPYGLDDYLLVNYQYWPGDPLRDPERLGSRSGPSAARGPYVAGNVSYTYPDLNNLFLAAARADGTVLIPSFHRPWLFGPLDRSNVNWRNREGKYLILRPRPEDHARDASGQPLFPYPEDATGDVKNWPWAPGGNDSLWIDIDAPVLIAPNGVKYKMLVAPLIIDLDNRLNVNVHGNVLGTNGDHRSNQGFGPWEVNLGKVLNADANEWKNLLLGRPAGGAPSWVGRFGANRRPRNGGSAVPLLATPHAYAPIDFDGCDEATGGPSGRLRLPAAGSPPTVFPSWGAGYGNASAVERANHPLLYNVFKTPVNDPTDPNDDRVFAPYNLAALLKTFDTNNDALQNCDLVRLCPLNLGNLADLNTARRRRLLTTTSFDLDRPGVVPYVWDPADPNTAYRFDPTRGYPTGAPIPFPNPTTARGATPANSEFSPQTWQSVDALAGRLNLDRPLRAYPAPDATTGVITNVAGYTQALNDRQQLARDLFDRLRRLTGAADPAAAAPGSREHDALRWLAQLAVNIVDYIDADDYITPFNWFGDEWVFGTELPRLVLNEAYVQYDNRPEDVAAGTVQVYRVNCWAELHNPFNTLPTLTNNGDAVLQVPNGGNPFPAYKVTLLGRRDAMLRNPNNVTGQPNPAEVRREVASWGNDPAKWVVQPSNGAYSRPVRGTQGFYVVGPNVTFPGPTDPGLKATFDTPEMSYEVPANDEAPLPRPTILLRRLACPHLPPNNTPGPMYNPYVTVDYMEDVQSNEGRLVNTSGAVVPPDVTERASWGKNQPFAAHISQRLAQAPNPPLRGQVKNTFYRHNAIEAAPPPAPQPGQTLKVPFDWLVHLDRQLVSPVELLHVSGFKPHELTQQFVAPTVADPNVIAPFQHYAPWLTPEARISRLFGFIENKDRLFETVQGGRVPGRINLNTVFDEEIFQALCDASPSNGFTPADVSAAWQRLLARRTPGGRPGPVNVDPRQWPQQDRPLLDPSTGYTAANPNGQYPSGVSIGDTILQPGLFHDPNSPGHPYVNQELLNKIYSNVTVRSNVFAIWLTVGFFEVKDDSTKPVKLGAEIGRAEGRHIRHRMFAVVDRTNALVFSYRLLGDLNPPAGGFLDVTFISQRRPDPLAGDTPGGLRWYFEVGVPLVFDPDNRREETTVVRQLLRSGAVPGQDDMFVARITQPHPTNTRIIGRGNVGPWPGYDPRQNSRMIPYWAIIE